MSSAFRAWVLVDCLSAGSSCVVILRFFSRPSQRVGLFTVLAAIHPAASSLYRAGAPTPSGNSTSFGEVGRGEPPSTDGRAILPRQLEWECLRRETASRWRDGGRACQQARMAAAELRMVLRGRDESRERLGKTRSRGPKDRRGFACGTGAESGGSSRGTAGMAGLEKDDAGLYAKNTLFGSLSDRHCHACVRVVCLPA